MPGSAAAAVLVLTVVGANYSQPASTLISTAGIMLAVATVPCVASTEATVNALAAQQAALPPLSKLQGCNKQGLLRCQTGLLLNQRRTYASAGALMLFSWQAQGSLPAHQRWGLLPAVAMHCKVGTSLEP